MEGKKMVKLVVLLMPKDDVDRDKYWKYWIEKHTSVHADPGIIRYLVSRVTEVEGGAPDKMWGMAEIWYRDREAHDADHRAIREGGPEIRQELEEFHTKLAWNWGGFMEEKVIYEDAGYEQAYREGKKLHKLLVLLQLKEGINPDAFWKYWIEVHAPKHLNRPALRKYTVNRVTEVNERSDPSRLWGMSELWYDSREAWDALRAQRGTDRDPLSDPEMRRGLQEFHSQLAWRAALIVEEKLIVGIGGTR